jgi:histidinol phosphatase-like PHP family hydrolase
MAGAPTDAERGRLSNAQLSELLCLAAEETGRPYHHRWALRRAGRAALRWPVEAHELLAEDRSLTELRSVGPWLAGILGQWLANPPIVPEPPLVRRGFLTHTECARLLAASSQRKLVRGDLQVHTIGSDGTASVLAMAGAAKERGLSYLAITDHSRGLAIANGMNEERLARQGKEIEGLNTGFASSGFRILHAVEMNLSPRGEGDLDARFLRGLDLVLGAFHSRLRVAEDQTDRYLAALRNPSIHILAHPRGRIFNFRLGLQADWRRVFECARDHDRAVEIDGYPDRQDLDGELLDLAREVGVRISIGSDAHAASQLAFLEFGIAAVRRAGIANDRIVNCMTASQLLAWASDISRARPHRPECIASAVGAARRR